MAKLTQTGQSQLATYRANPPIEDEAKVRLTILEASERGTFTTTDALITHLADADEVYSDEVWEAEVEQLEQEGLILCPPVYGEPEEDYETEIGATSSIGSEHSEACQVCGESTGSYSDFSICMKCLSEKTAGMNLPPVGPTIEDDSMTIKFNDL